MLIKIIQVNQASYIKKQKYISLFQSYSLWVNYIKKIRTNQLFNIVLEENVDVIRLLSKVCKE